jgi:hypothetical protein
MTKENVRFIKNAVTKVFPNKAIRVRLDNDFSMNERSEFLHWDDNKELITQVYRNTEATTQGDRPFKIVWADYDQIQHIEVDASKDDFPSIAKDCGFTDDQIKRMMGSIIFTLDDYSDSISNQVKGRAHDVIT